jgi:hypothetical protein
MWTPCPRITDDPVMKWGYEFEDFLLILGLPCVLILVVPPLYCLGLVVVLAAVIRTGKRGKPRGAIWHWLHAHRILRLPGFIPAHTQRYQCW